MLKYDSLVCLCSSAGVTVPLSYEMFVQSYRPAAFMFLGLIIWAGFTVFGFLFPFLLVSYSHAS